MASFRNISSRTPTVRPSSRCPQYAGRTLREARPDDWMERAAAGNDTDEDQGATNRRYWGWVFLFLAGLGLVLTGVYLSLHCWSLSSTIGC